MKFFLIRSHKVGPRHNSQDEVIRHIESLKESEGLYWFECNNHSQKHRTLYQVYKRTQVASGESLEDLRTLADLLRAEDEVTCQYEILCAPITP